MTQDEQQRIVYAIGDIPAISIGKRAEAWAVETFGKDGLVPKLGYRGVWVEYRVSALNEWQQLTYIYFPKMPVESSSDRNRRMDSIKRMFVLPNEKCSNRMGDVIAVRYMPFIEVDGVRRFKEDETRVFECTDTKERRQWNELEFSICDEPHDTMASYHLVKSDISEGDNINWYQSWHFSLADDEPCPVAPVIVEHVDDYSLVLRYRDRLFALGMELDQQHSAELETDVPVTPTHAWNSLRLRKPYTFKFMAELTWQKSLYGSTDRDLFDYRTQRFRTSDLPTNVRTREQIDHDAWDEAVRSGQI